MRPKVEREPDRTPRPGDYYLEPIHGLRVQVMQVERDRVHYVADNGWRASMAMEQFRGCRRFVAK